jgi:hypothetical protein
LSNTEAQDKITQQSQADQLSQQKAIDNLRASDQAKSDKAVASARSGALQEGYNHGKTDQSVQDQAVAQQQYQSGLTQGQTQGQQQGQQQQSQQDQASLQAGQAAVTKLAIVCSGTPTPPGC